MKNALKIAAAIAGLCTLPAHADVSLTYELNGPDMEPRSKTFSLARFFARIDDPAEPKSYLLYQTGKFFPLYRVDTIAGTYTRLTPEVKPTLFASARPQDKTTQQKPLSATKETTTAEEPASSESASMPVPSAIAEQTAPAQAQAESKETQKQITEATSIKDTTPTEPAPAESAAPTESTPAQTTTATAEQPAGEKPADPASKTEAEKPKTSLRLTKKSKKIAGISCREVEELAGDKVVMTHCMADKARLGVTEREVRSLSRLFNMARERNFGWLGTATVDEKFASIASHDLQSNKTLQLKSVSTKPLPAGYLRIPKRFKQIQGK